jgi:hypothetical protein
MNYTAASGGELDLSRLCQKLVRVTFFTLNLIRFWHSSD